MCTTIINREDRTLSDAENIETEKRRQDGDSERHVVNEQQRQARMYETKKKRKETYIEKEKELKRPKIAVERTNALVTKLVGDIEMERSMVKD